MYKIMVVDDSLTILSIARAVLAKDYKVLIAKSGEEALLLLEGLDVLPDLILLDVIMPTLGGFEVIRRLKKDKTLSEIPIIFLSAQDDHESEMEGLTLGAIDYIKKPFSVPLLKKRIQLHLKVREQKNRLEFFNFELEKLLQIKSKTILELQAAIVMTVTDLIGKRDGFTGEHVYRVESYMKVLLDDLIQNDPELDLSKTDMDMIASCSKLHDLGKIGIKDDVLLKEGKLTGEEMESIRQHAMLGAESIKNSMRLVGANEFLVYALQMIKSHHEKWDGTGYPERLKGKEIPFVARVMAIADVYDALTSERPYKKPIPHDKVVDIICRDSGTHFDPDMVEAFLRVKDAFSVINDSYTKKGKKAKNNSQRIIIPPPANTALKEV